MSYFRVIDPAEVAFFRWLNEFPDSYHPCDMGRFYSFVDTVIHYQKSYGKKWRNKDVFVSACKKYNPRLDNECIMFYWNRFEAIKDYHRFKRPAQLMKSHTFNDDCFGYYAQAVANGEIETIPIDKEIYNRKHVSRTFILKLLDKNYKDRK